MNTPNRSFATNRRHWIAAAMLAALVCGVSYFNEEDKVETNDEKLFDLCEDPKATPEAIETLLKAGASRAPSKAVIMTVCWTQSTR